MSRLVGRSLKRKQPDQNSPSSSLTEDERIIYELIKSKKGMGIWTRDMKRETNLPDIMVNRPIKALQAKKLIKEVMNIQSRGRKHYIAVGFEPSEEITGGAWYSDGKLDKEFIEILKQRCLEHIKTLKIATIEMVADAIRESRVSDIGHTTQQIGEIVKVLVLDDMVMELNSTGTGEFASIPTGSVCYKCTNKTGQAGQPKTGAMSSIPCGLCPRIRECTPDGIVSPTTCEYYKKWLSF